MRFRAEVLTMLILLPIGALAEVYQFSNADHASTDEDRIVFDNNKIEERHRESKQQSTPPDVDIIDWIDQGPTMESKNTESPKNIKYQIRDFDTCIPGRESVNSCESIPGQTRCDDGTYPITRQILDENGYFERQYRLCPGDTPQDTIPEGQIIPEDQINQEISIDVERFRSYPIKASSISSNPNSFSLRNAHTHFWAKAETQTFTSNLSGASVRIRAIPIQWIWDYGDGATKSFDFPGEAMPHHTLRDKTPTSHSYNQTGTFSVGATTLYRGEFSVEGGPWQAIPGQAAVPSEPIEMDVWRTEKELIAID